MNNQFKRVIAREGLIMLGFIILIVLLMCIPAISLFIDNLVEKYIKHGHIIWDDNPPLDNTIQSVIPFVLSCYPLYWVVRFIIWAIRMLKQKE